MLSCPNYLLSEYCYLMIISDPKSYYHAQKDPRWQVAMDEEMNSLQKNTTWELVSLPPGGIWFNASGYFGIRLLLMVSHKNIRK